MKRAMLAFDLLLLLALGLWVGAAGAGTQAQASAQVSALVSTQAVGDAAPAHVPSIPSISSCPSPSFGPTTNFAAGPSPHSVAVGDFNKDGKLDLVAADH